MSHFWVYGFAEVASDEIWLATFGGGIDIVVAGSLGIIERLRHDPSPESTIGGVSRLPGALVVTLIEVECTLWQI